MKLNFLEKRECSSPVWLNEEMLDDARDKYFLDRYSLSNYYEIKLGENCDNRHLKTYALEGGGETDRLPFVFDAFIYWLKKFFPPETYYIEKLDRDISFSYDPWTHNLTVKIRACFTKKD